MDELRGPLSLPPLHRPADRRGGAFRGASAFLAGLLLATAAVAGGGCAARPSAWENSFDSAEALATAVLAAYNRGDAVALTRYALSEHELRTTIWPHLPASRPDVGMDWPYFWRDHAQRSGSHLKTLLQAHAGRGYQLVALSFDGRAAYGPVTVHREAAIDVRAPGRPARLRLTGSMVEWQGRWKLYSYVVD